MAKSSQTNVPFRRKREGKRDYKKMLSLLVSRQNRLVIRVTQKNIIMQLTEYNPDGDKILLSVHSGALEKLGWQHNRGNLPAAYLTGLLFGVRAQQKNYTKAIVDTGLQTSVKASRIYAAIKGVLDSGFEVPAGEEMFPSEERIKGEHINESIAQDFDKIVTKIQSD